LWQSDGARQNVISDPPFSRMDLISCRNLLIYFEPGLQKRVFPVFHYALKPGGFLYLGASESIGGFTGLFEPVDAKPKSTGSRIALNQFAPPAVIINDNLKVAVSRPTGASLEPPMAKRASTY
jgi:hypothetical protein